MRTYSLQGGGGGVGVEIGGDEFGEKNETDQHSKKKENFGCCQST